MKAKATLFFAAWMLASVSLCYAKYSLEMEKQDILADPIYTTARISDVQESSRYKRGVEITSYQIHYEYEVEGTPYTGIIQASSSEAAKYLDRDIIEVGYKAGEPALHMKLNDLENALKLSDLTPTFIQLSLTLIPFVFIAFIVIQMAIDKLSGRSDAAPA